MFFHEINNTNNFTIQKNNYYIIPFGHRCSSALACKYANIRQFSLPFDWTMLTYPHKIKDILENDFNNFIPDIKNNIFTNNYNVRLEHFNIDINKGIEEYIRRINRIKSIFNTSTNKIYFIYINEDYLYDATYRNNEFINKIFKDMLDLELYMKSKYPIIDFNIIYFDFKKYNIPENSKIINIVLYTKILYNNWKDSPYEQFRIYCAKVLTKLFNTKLLIGYNLDTFNN